MLVGISQVWRRLLPQQKDLQFSACYWFSDIVEEILRIFLICFLSENRTKKNVYKKKTKFTPRVIGGCFFVVQFSCIKAFWTRWVLSLPFGLCSTAYENVTHT